AWTLARVAQRLGELPGSRRPRLWCLSGAVRESRTPGALAQSCLWGMSRVVAKERPDLWGGLVDLAAEPSGGDVAALADVLRQGPTQEVISLRNGVPEVARLTPLSGAPVRRPLRCRPGGTYLVTGGLGTLGGAIAQWLVERGARRLVLAGRRALPPREDWDTVRDQGVRRRIGTVRALEDRGVTVRTVALDICDPDAARRALSPGALDLPPIRGVVHAAGVLDNRLLGDLDERSLRTVLRPKVDGALVLDELFPPGSVDFFVPFSSCGQLLGITGQTSYAAANAFLDALATRRSALGCPGSTSLGWTSWRGMGMAVNEVVDLELAAQGVGSIEPAEAFAAWEYASRRATGQVTVLRRAAGGEGAHRTPLLRDLPDAAEPGAADSEDGFGWEAEPERLRERLAAEVTSSVAATLRIPADRLRPHRELTDLGMDSVMALIIVRKLERRLGLALPTTLLWHRPSIGALVDHLAALGSDDPPAVAVSGRGQRS
ncbi:beta-ketoacyl reductase, partial [Streptomyces sp. NPDC055078]